MAKIPKDRREKILREVCARVARGETIKGMCGKSPQYQTKINPHLPGESTIRRWLSGKDDEMREWRTRYSRALELAADSLAEEMLEIARRTSPTTAHADRVKMDALRWIASKRRPRVYGDRQQVDLHATVTEDRPLRESAPDWLIERLTGPATTGTATH